MLGITMQESGVSKVIALKLDQDIKLGAEVDKTVTDFKEENVPEEEGIVLPPRPPRRIKNNEAEENGDGTVSETNE